MGSQGPLSVLVITGTGTDVGKTVVTASLAALARAAGRRVAVCKPVQTGAAPDEPSDLACVQRLAGPLTTLELLRFDEALSPGMAARRAGHIGLKIDVTVEEVEKLRAAHDLVLVEGAGGPLSPLNPKNESILDVSLALRSPVLLVTQPVLGTLSTTAVATEAVQRRNLECLGLVIGSWPSEPGLAERCNLLDLPEVTGLDLLGALPSGAGQLAPRQFSVVSEQSLAPRLGGRFDSGTFTQAHQP